MFINKELVKKVLAFWKIVLKVSKADSRVKVVWDVLLRGNKVGYRIVGLE